MSGSLKIEFVKFQAADERSKLVNSNIHVKFRFNDVDFDKAVG